MCHFQAHVSSNLNIVSFMLKVSAKEINVFLPSKRINVMIAFPNAKINIGLNVTGRRSDGYHNIETVFYPVKINDVIEVVEGHNLTFENSGIEIPGNREDNLCLKAYDLLKHDFKLPPVAIHLHKNIPIGAGLGGGSSDAAFFLRLLNTKFELRLTDLQMEDYARQLGADCAFFIRNRPVFAYEKGDRFKDVSLDLSSYFIALVMPDVHVSTNEAYKGIRPSKPKEDLCELMKLPVKKWKDLVRNDFEDSIFPNHSEIRGVKAALYEAGALYASMSGSGASVYGIFDKKVELADLEKENVVYYGV